jgi:pimeloyl-ACP methyl ester carboxylesterase
MVLWSVPQVAADRSRADRAKRSAVLKAYWQKLFRAETWSKLLGGALNLGMIRKAILRGGKGEGEENAPEDREIDYHRRFIEFRGAIYYIYGTNDPTTPECIAHYQRLSRQAGRNFECDVVEGANHSFYSLKWEAEVLDQSLGWLEARYPGTPAGEGASTPGPLPSGAPA